MTALAATGGGGVTFSIIVPVYNRAGMIGRALESCLRQGYCDFEVLVVDDASVDGTVGQVRRYADPRIRLLQHRTNRGVCAARNTAIDAATGQWCIMLDSDFELRPGALASLAARCQSVAPDVGNVASMCAWDNGPDTPIPAPAKDVVYDYPGYLRYFYALRIPESFNCIRREVFTHVRYPEGRAYEGGFHLEMALHYHFSLTRERYVLIHTDAPNRITASPPLDMARRLVRDAPDSAREIERILRLHGDAIAVHCPAAHLAYIREGVVHHLLAGDPVAARRLLQDAPSTVWGSPRLWAFLGLGQLGPWPLATLKACWTTGLLGMRRWFPARGEV